MTVIPQLEKRLVEAAAGLQERRTPARRARPGAIVVAAVVAVAAALVIALPASPPDEREATAPPAAEGLAELRERFSVFERPPTPAGDPGRRRAVLDRTLGSAPVWVVAEEAGVVAGIALKPTSRGTVVCDMVAVTQHAGGGSCRPMSALLGQRQVAVQSTTTAPGGRQAFFAFVDDEVRTVRLTLRDGRTLERRPKDNAVLAVLDSGVAEVSVVDGQGESSTESLYDDPVDPSD